MRVSAGLDAHHHWPRQRFVESLGLPVFVHQPALRQLARFLVQHRYHLKARMKVTAYILHMRPPSSRALGHKQIEFTRDDLGAVVVIQSSDSEGALRPEGESKDRENISFVHTASGSSTMHSASLRCFAEAIEQSQADHR